MKSKVTNYVLFKSQKISTYEHKSFLKNLFSLGLIQGTNFLLPLLIFPYLVRNLGIENFGIITLVQTIMNYFIIITDYGFNLSATKEVSLNRSNPESLSTTFSEVMLTKVLLLVVSLAILVIAVFTVPGYEVHSFLVLSSFFIVLGQVLQPVWFFQGIEQMKYLTYINLISKGLYAISIFAFVSNASDYIYVNFLNGICASIGGIVSLFFVFNKKDISLKKVTIVQVISQLQKGWSIFISSVSITISNSTNLSILSFFTNILTVGYYSIAEKVFLFARTLAGVLYQAVYPKACLLAQTSFAKLIPFLRQIFAIIVISFLPLSFITFIFSDTIIFFIADKHIPEAATILRIVSFAPLFAALNIPASQTLLAFHKDKIYARIATIMAATNVASNMVLANYFHANGTAYAVMITEVCFTITLYYTIEKFFPQYSLIRR